PSRLGYLLDLAPKDLEKVIYFAAYIITRVDVDRRHRDLPEIDKDLDAEKHQIEAHRDQEVHKRQAELDDRLRDLESEGIKGAALTAARRESDRDVVRIRDAAQLEIQDLD